MARLNGTSPYRDVLAAYFEEWSDADLRDFIHATKDFASRRSLSAKLSTAIDIARQLAEAERDARALGQAKAAYIGAD